MTENSKSFLGSEKIRTFFIDHLNRLYCAQSHLAERLPEILEEAAFIDLKQAIKDTIVHTEKQLSKIDEIYEILDTTYSFENCQTLINFLERSFQPLQLHATENDFSDLMVVTYLYQTECVQLSESKILEATSGSFSHERVKILVKELCQEAKNENALLLLLLKKTAR